MTRVLALLAALAFAAVPVLVFLQEPSTLLVLKIAWVALFALACWRPGWSTFVLLICVPLAPWLPYMSRAVPHGIVHLILLSQAIPFLLRVGAGRQRFSSDAVGLWWLLLVCVALASALTQYGVGWLIADDMPAFWSGMREQMSAYVFDRPSVHLHNVLTALTTLMDGAVAYLLARLTLPAERLRAALRVAVMTAVGVSLFGCWQPFGRVGLRAEWGWFDPLITRVNATYSDPNALAAFLVLMLPVSWGLAGASRGRERWGYLLAGGVMLAALILTNGRMAQGALLVAGLIFLVGILRSRLHVDDPWIAVRRYLQPLLKAALVATLVFLSVFVVMGTTLDVRHHDQRSRLHTWLYTFNLRQPLNEITKGRMGIWQVAVRMIEERPVFGVGIGRIYRQFRGYAQDVAGAPSGVSLSAHNTFLTIGAELGLVGLTVWIGLLLVAGWALLRPLVRRDAAMSPELRDIRWIQWGVAAGVLAFVGTMMTGDRTVLREDTVIFGVILAVGLALARGGDPGVPRARTRWSLTLACLLVLALVPVRASIDKASVRLDRIQSGLHALETGSDGAPYRWTTGRVLFYVPSERASLTFEVRSLAPFAQTMAVRLNGADVDRIALTDHAWHRVSYVMPRHDRLARYHRVELFIDPTFTPPGDGRELGVMLRGAF